jgi:ABC-type nitrate/sulfonate/bicarbonate transport system substrate-binding protein
MRRINRGLWLGLLAALLLRCGAPPPATANSAPAAPATQPPTVAVTQPDPAPPSSAGGEIRLGHSRAWSNPALVLGLHQGWFQRAGVTVVEQEFSSPATILQAIASGDMDAAATALPTLFSAVHSGVKAKAVALLQGNNNPANAFSVLADSGIYSAQDLRGKRAGVTVYGGANDIHLRYYLAKEGLDPATDVEIVAVPVPAVLPSLINRQIDIGQLASLDIPRARQQYPDQLRTLFTNEDVFVDATGSPDHNVLVLAFADSFIQRDRPTAVRFLEGYLRSVRAMNADPKKALNEWADAVNNDALRALPAPPVVPDDGKLFLSAVPYDHDQTLRFGYLPAALDWRAAIDHSLVEEAAANLQRS